MKTTSITFPGRVPGNNGPGGLLRMHWATKTKLLNTYKWQVLEAVRGAKHAGPVRLELVRYSTGTDLDYDNLVSTGKLLTDAIVSCRVILDDKPAVIMERIYCQERVTSQGQQRTIITITDLSPAEIQCLTPSPAPLVATPTKRK